jgi:DNA replication licensing factor MCM2
VPTFLQSDDDDDGGVDGGLLSGINVRRARRQYDERMDDDDAGEDEEMSLEHLGDVKTATIAEWIDVDIVRNAIQKHFRSFLMTFTDANGGSVYGQRIKALGEGRQTSQTPRAYF